MEAAGDSPSERPEVSVVIPTRNRCARLGRTLDGAQRQVDVCVEVIVVDDGSTDATPFWLSTAASDRLRVVRHRSPRGLPQARNAGIALAQSPWIAFLDDDDLWSPRKLRYQLDALAVSSAAWSYGSAVYVEDDLSPYTVDEAPPAEGLLDRLLAEQVVPAGASNVVVRSDLLRDAGGFDESLPNLADWDLWLRLAQRAPAVACAEVLLACVQHRDNMHSRQDTRRFFRELADFADRHEALRRTRGVAFDDRSFAYWLADACMRARRPVAASFVNVRDGLRHRDPRSVRRAVRPFLGPRRLRRPRSAVLAPEWLSAYSLSPSDGRRA